MLGTHRAVDDALRFFMVLLVISVTFKTVNCSITQRNADSCISCKCRMRSELYIFLKS